MIRITLLLLTISISGISQEIWHEHNFKLITNQKYRDQLKSSRDTSFTIENITMHCPIFGRPACAYAFLFEGGLPAKTYILGDSCTVISEINPNLGSDISYIWPKEVKNGWFALLYKDTKTPYLKFHYTNSKYDGGYYEYYDNGQLMFSTNYSKGKLHGTSISYSKSGIPIRIRTFVNGQNHGADIKYFTNGNLESITNYRHGVKHDVSKTYNSIGQVIASCNYNNGKKNGEDFLRTKDSIIISHYQQDKFYGGRYFFNKDSVLINQWNYSSGTLHGPYINYYESGIQKEYRTKIQNKFDKDWFLYDNTGVIIMKSNYYEGLENGTRKYYDDGDLIAQTKYKKGVVKITEVFDNELKKELKEIEPWTSELKLKFK